MTVFQLTISSGIWQTQVQLTMTISTGILVVVMHTAKQGSFACLFFYLELGVENMVVEKHSGPIV